MPQICDFSRERLLRPPPIGALIACERGTNANVNRPRKLGGPHEEFFLVLSVKMDTYSNTSEIVKKWLIDVLDLQTLTTTWIWPREDEEGNLKFMNADWWLLHE